MRVSCLKCGATAQLQDGICPRCGAKLRPPKVRNKSAKKRKRLTQPESSSAPKQPAASARLDDFIDRIICGDCLEILPQIPPNSIDLIVTSPPYNFGLDGYDVHDDARNWDQYFARLEQCWRLCYRLLKPGGRICVVVQPLFSDYVPTHHIISAQLREIGFIFKAEILWEKHNYNCKYTAWGSWCSPSQPYLKYTWEFIEVFCRDSQKKPGPRKKSDLQPEEFKRWVYAKWEIAPETRMKRFDHPSMFPEEIPRRLIKLFSFRGDVVLDPFNGVGTTTVVAAQLGRRFIGIDISEKYCRTAQQRLKEALRQRALFG